MIDSRPHIVVNKIFLHIIIGNMLIVELLPILFALSASGIRTLIGKIQGRIMAKFGNQMSTELFDHLQRIVMPKGAIKNKGLDHRFAHSFMLPLEPSTRSAAAFAVFSPASREGQSGSAATQRGLAALPQKNALLRLCHPCA